MTLAARVADVDAAQAAGQTIEPGQKQLKDVLRDMEPQLRDVLPKHVDLSRFLLLAVNEVSTVPRLAECTAASVVTGVIRAAKLGLEFSQDRGQAFLVPRWNSRARCMEATFQIGYKGLIDLAGRGGIHVRARDVREGDRFEFEDGLEPILRHVPDLKRERGDAWAYFAVATFPDGAKEFLVMARSEIETHRDRFASAKNKAGDVVGPWTEHFDAMARKTVILRLLGNLPLPVNLAEAVAADDVPLDLTPAPSTDAAPDPELPASANAESDGASPTAERGPAASAHGTDEPSPEAVDGGAEAASPPTKSALDLELEGRRDLATYLLDEARKANAPVKAFRDERGIPANPTQWTAAQIEAVIAWITEDTTEAPPADEVGPMPEEVDA